MDNEPAKYSNALQFPCDFTFKIMGKANDSFEINVLMIIKQYFPVLKENAITQKHSKGKNYLSLSITVYAENQALLDQAYQNLSKCPDVLMAL